MTCHIKPSANLSQAMTIAQKFAQISLIELNDPSANHHRKRIDCLFLAARPPKKQTLVYQSRGIGAKRRQLESSYHRFFLFQVVNTTTVFAMFTVNQDSSLQLLKYWKELKPGTSVSILNPKIEGTLPSSNNLLLTSSNPLIPCAVVAPVNVMPPEIVLANSNDYQAFSFITTKLNLENVCLRNDQCPGFFSFLI